MAKYRASLYSFTVLFMIKLHDRLRNKNIIFDFIFLFAILIGASTLFLISTYMCYGKPLFDSEDLKVLNYDKFLLAIFIIPAIEEFGTRGIFALRNRAFILLFILCTSIVLYTFISNAWLSIPIFFIILVTGVTSFCNVKYRVIINTYIKNNFINFLLFSSVVFGLLHINNYKIVDIHTYLKILPRILGGIYLGYIANKYGIIYSCLMHSINNMIPVALAFIYTHLS